MLRTLHLLGRWLNGFGPLHGGDDGVCVLRLLHGRPGAHTLLAVATHEWVVRDPRLGRLLAILARGLVGPGRNHGSGLFWGVGDDLQSGRGGSGCGLLLPRALAHGRVPRHAPLIGLRGLLILGLWLGRWRPLLARACTAHRRLLRLLFLLELGHELLVGEEFAAARRPLTRRLSAAFHQGHQIDGHCGGRPALGGDFCFVVMMDFVGS